MKTTPYLLGLAVATLACVVGPMRPAQANIITDLQERAVLHDSLSGKLTKVSFPTPALGGTRSAFIYTPPGYSATASRTYPVLILLHGSPGDSVDWLYKGHAHQRLDSAIHSGQFPASIMVIPDGHGPFYKGGSEWADSVDGRCRMETAVTRDLPHFLSTNYRVSQSKAEWTIGGLSEGAYGAANLMTRHPDIFHNAIVLSGEMSVSDDWGDTQQVFGDSPLNRIQNSPALELRHVAPAVRSQLHFYVAVGEEDDADLISENEAFVTTCRSLGIPVQFDRDRGNHKWDFWGGHFQTSLKTLAGWLKTGTGA